MRLARTAPIDRAARIIDSRCQREGARFSISVCLAQHQPASSGGGHFRPGASPKGPSALTLQPTQAHRHYLSETYNMAISIGITSPKLTIWPFPPIPVAANLMSNSRRDD